jgi:hypothetical protein
VLFLNVALDFKKAVVSGTDLVSKIWMTRELLKKVLLNPASTRLQLGPYMVNVAKCSSERIKTESWTDTAKLAVDLEQLN